MIRPCPESITLEALGFMIWGGACDLPAGHEEPHALWDGRITWVTVETTGDRL